MEEKVSGLVLNGISYGENDKILSIFTLEKGLISAKIKGVKKAGAKLKFASQPFCFAEFILRKASAGYTVINASLIESFYSIREDVFKYYAGVSILEFVKKFYRENIVSKNAFLSTINGLKEVAFGENYLQDLARFFITALKQVGYALDLKGCASCQKKECARMFFDYSSGAFYCQDCFNGEGREINPDTFLALNKAENDQPIEKEQAVRALRLIDYYLQNKAEESIGSLQELLKMLA